MARKSLVEREKLKIKLVTNSLTKERNLKRPKEQLQHSKREWRHKESFKNYQGGPIQIELLGDVH